MANRFATSGSSPVLYFTPLYTNIYTQRPQSKEDTKCSSNNTRAAKIERSRRCKRLGSSHPPLRIQPVAGNVHFGARPVPIGQWAVTGAGHGERAVTHALRVSLCVRVRSTRCDRRRGGTKGGQIRGASRRTFRSEKLYCGRLMVSELVSRCGRTTDEGGCDCRCCVGKCGDSGVS